MPQSHTHLAAAVERLWDADPGLLRLLRESDDIKTVRQKMRRYLRKHERLIEDDEAPVHVLEWVNMRECRRVLKHIFGSRSEALCGFSALETLWKLAREEELGLEISEAFIEEFRHLFVGMLGQSRIYEGEAPPAYLQHTGRVAAVARSSDLDDIADRVNDYISRYPTGLDAGIRARRSENRKRILAHFGAAESDWKSHRWHLKHVIRDSATLGALIDITDEEREAIDRARAHHIAFGITPYYVSLMDVDTSRANDHSIRAQVIPSLRYVNYMTAHRSERHLASDYMLERDTSPVDLVTRRYPRIAILKPYNSCAQICVYCQRNWEMEEVLAGGAMAPPHKMEDAYQWFRHHPGVNEVLVTGGDPFIMSNSRIERILENLALVPHITRIRLGTRTPVVLPQRITDKLVNIIARYHEPGRRYICVTTHFEHVYEVTPEAVEAVSKFNKKGIYVFNQLVYTIENSRRFEAVALRELLRNSGVSPYYTFNSKGKDENRDFKVPIARLLQEQKEEARLVPGVVRTDEAVFNVPRLGKNYVRAYQDHDVVGVMPDGARVYEIHPWEKKIALTDTYVETDVPILDYLSELERRGEDLDDYKSIWFYF
jgi:lysine 2,3-aminomutase